MGPVRSRYTSSSEGTRRDVPFPREPNTPSSGKRFPASAPMGNEGRGVGDQSWTGAAGGAEGHVRSR